MALADKADAPMGCSLMGLSAVSADNPHFLGMQGMHGHYASSAAESEADLVITLGARFSDRATDTESRFAKGAKIIHIDIDNAEIQKNIPVYLGIQGDIKDALSRLSVMIKERKHPVWRRRIDFLRTEEWRHTENGFIKAETAGIKLTPYTIIDTISSHTNENTIIATDVGQHQMWTAQRYPFRKPRAFITNGGLGAMGFGLGAAIGAAIASGKRTVLITGDGSFGMNLNELATAVSQKLPIIIVIMNNGVLGMVRQWQTLFYEKHYSATTLNRQTNFIKLAEAFGGEGMHAETESELQTAVAKAFSSQKPFIIDCAVNCDEFVLPMLPSGASVGDIITEI